MARYNRTHYRQQLRDVFNSAINNVRGEDCVERWLRTHPVRGPVHLLAIGKAAASMAQGALAALPRQIEEGLVITKKGHCGPFTGASQVVDDVSCVEAAHPIPDQTSLDAGNRLLHFVQAIPLHSPVLILISGGTSSLVEVLPQNVSLQDWQQVNEWLLGHSLSIDQINVVRKRISCIKGGRLAPYLAEKRVICLMISDVKNDDPSVIGSGMLVADRSTHQDFSEAMADGLPPHIVNILKTVSRSPDPSDPCFKSINVELVATLQDAKTAAKNTALEMGCEVYCHDEFVEGDAIKAGRALAKQLLEGPEGMHIWGGETTVDLPKNPGRGGRNQSLALAAAQVLHDNDNVYFLAAGTDGTDGPGEDAGALVDGGTQNRGITALQGDSLDEYLKNADAGTFLSASGDLIRTGPTGTNVMDLMVGLKV